MKKSALLVAAFSAGAAVLLARYVVKHRETTKSTTDSVQNWIESADQHLQKLQLKLTSNKDSQVA